MKKDLEQDLKPEQPKSKANKDHKWFIISTYSGHEKKVANQIKQRVKANDLEDSVSDVVVPTQEKIVVSAGKKKK